MSERLCVVVSGPSQEDYRKQSHHMIGAIRCVQKHRECRRDDRWGSDRIMLRVRHPRKIRGELKKITRKHDEPDDPTPTHECRGLRRRQVGRRCVRLCADLTVPAKTDACIRRNKNRFTITFDKQPVGGQILMIRNTMLNFN